MKKEITKKYSEAIQRGFSAVNIKRMRQFFETWENVFAVEQNGLTLNRPLPTDDLQNKKNKK